MYLQYVSIYLLNKGDSFISNIYDGSVVIKSFTLLKEINTHLFK